MVGFCVLFFFFSSRRRHTRYWRDWTDVCSSDLISGVLVMGPDCGTAIVSGVALGFANVVRRGPVCLVAASGTGAQQISRLLDMAGVAVSHVLGVGRPVERRVGQERRSRWLPYY